MESTAEKGWYLGVSKEGSSELREFGSRFLGFCARAETLGDVRVLQTRMRSEHPQATHWCSASILNPLSPELRSNDDGEPAHTAGAPILRAMQAAGVQNAMVGVVRYYGGTQLGRPGLIKAYKSCAEEALANARFEKISLERVLRIELAFEDEHRIYRLAQRKGLQVKSLDRGTRSSLGLCIPLPQFAQLETEVRLLAESIGARVELIEL